MHPRPSPRSRAVRSGVKLAALAMALLVVPALPCLLFFPGLVPSPVPAPAGWQRWIAAGAVLAVAWCAARGAGLRAERQITCFTAGTLLHALLLALPALGGSPEQIIDAVPMLLLFDLASCQSMLAGLLGLLAARVLHASRQAPAPADPLAGRYGR